MVRSKLPIGIEPMTDSSVCATEDENEPWGKAPPTLVPLQDLLRHVEAHLHVPRRTAAAYLRAAIESGQISHHIVANQEEKEAIDADVFKFQFPGIHKYFIDKNINDLGGWSEVNWENGSISERSILVSWLEVANFVKFNQHIFLTPPDMPADPALVAPASAAVSLVSSERQCQTWLEAMMRDTTVTPIANSVLSAEARAKFKGLSSGGFRRAKRKAVGATGATRWQRPGRKRPTIDQA